MLSDLLTPEERVLCEELIQLLAAYPHHFAGHGHGVGLLEHTLNVVAEVADKCTAEFRLPVIAALAHDIGKLISFVPTSNGEWRRQGLHSREGARILATLPSFPLLPEDYRNALLLAVKYGHAPNKIPSLRGDTKASMLALRVIAAMSQADRSATAGEKDRNLVKLQPEDLLWQDFVDFLREAPIVQRGKMGAANQVNNPPGSPYLYIYEAPWRDAAMHRMPAEVAAALDLTRRDAGKLAKYTRILAARLRKDGLLVEEYEGASVSEANPLWDIQSGTGEKSLVLRGVLVLRAEKLLRLVNYRLSATSPYPVQLLAPNASVGGVVNKAPDRKKEAPTPEVSDSIRLSPLSDTATLIQVGVSDAPASTVDSATAPEAAPPHAPKVRSKFKNPEADAAMGLTPATGTPLTEKPQPGLQVDPEHAKVTDTEADPPKTAMELLAAVTPTEAPQPKSENLPPAIEAHGSAGTPIEVLPSAPPGESTPTPSGVPATKVIDSENQGLAPGTKLSRVEEQEGLAIADDKACLLYPKLVIGDKYYTAQSRSVRVGATSPGGRYKGGDKLKQLDSQAPRRSKKRF